MSRSKKACDVRSPQLWLALPMWFAVLAFSMSGACAEVSFSDQEISRLKLFGPWPATMQPDPGNEFSGQMWAETLGEKLFHSTDLSGNQSLSCASCHQPDNGFTDGLAVASGVKQHVRNTQGLLNAGYQRWFGWDGGADSLWAASLRPMLSDIEMSADTATTAKRLRSTEYFVQALSGAGVNVNSMTDEALLVVVGKVLAAYQRTLVSGQTAFDRYLTALQVNDVSATEAYADSAKRGMKIFFGDANCHTCHFGPNFSNGEFHDIGRPFFTGVGKVDPGRYAGIKRVQSDRFNLAGSYNTNTVETDIQKTLTVKLGQVNFGQWRTPGLRNLVSTAPYMHDGSLATLRDVVDAYADIDPARLHAQGEAILKPQDWTEQQRQDLVSFLQSLSEK